jgi:hypothetical protein
VAADADPGRITALVPTYNRVDFLGECLDALLAQTRPVHEIIVVDDGSTDGTEERVAALAAALPQDAPRLRYLYQRNQGKSAALNQGLVHCRGGSVWICDDDDLALPRAAEVLVQGLLAHGAGFCFGRYRRFRDDPATGRRVEFAAGYWPDLSANHLALTLMEDFFLFQNATLVRRDALAAVGPFRTDLIRSQDYEMALRLALRVGGAFVDEPVFLQREHGGDRGSEARRFSACRQVETWMENDGAILRDLVTGLPLSAFVPKGMPETANDGAVERAARLQRGCILARRRLWGPALADLAEAALLAPDQALHPVERAVCSRVLLAKYGCAEILADGRVPATLARIAAIGPVGAEMVRLIARPLLWRAREAMAAGRLDTALGFAGVLHRLQGLRGSSDLVWAALRRRSAPSLSAASA